MILFNLSGFVIYFIHEKIYSRSGSLLCDDAPFIGRQHCCPRWATLEPATPPEGDSGRIFLTRRLRDVIPVHPVASARDVTHVSRETSVLGTWCDAI